MFAIFSGDKRPTTPSSAVTDISPNMISASSGRKRRNSSLAAANMALELLTSPTRHAESSLRLNDLQETNDVNDPESALTSSPVAPLPPRRRAVDRSDIRSCALVQQHMKSAKNWPE